MDDIDFWKLSDELTVVQAALLVVGQDPSPVELEVERKTPERQPRGYNAAKNAIMSAIRSNLLKGELRYEAHDIDEMPYHSPSLSLVNVEDLKRWLRSKGFEKHFFFFPEGLDGKFLDVQHPRYSPKLAAAVRAWEALDNDDLLTATTPKKAAQKWLRINAVDFNLSDSDGNPIESAIEEISKVVNWDPKGGAPSTPTVEPIPKKLAKAGVFSVEKPQVTEGLKDSAPNFDDDTTF